MQSYLSIGLKLRANPALVGLKLHADLATLAKLAILSELGLCSTICNLSFESVNILDIIQTNWRAI